MPLRMHRQRSHQVVLWSLTLAPAVVLIGCSTAPTATSTSEVPTTPTVSAKPSSLPALPRAGSGKGAYYMDDGPGENPPEGLLDTPDAEPKIEPYATRGNRPYVVFGKSYTPMVDERPYKQRGIGSWYGKKFHGQKTSSGEPYDMYKMTAAHPTLPIPSYVRVTNVDNGKQVIVRVNDRGPFHSGRIIDLSYTAALKLGYLAKGSGMLEVERLLPEEIMRISKNKKEQPAVTQASQGRDVFAVATVQDSIDTRPQQPVTALPPGPVQTAEAKPSDTLFAKPVLVSSNAVGNASGFYLQLGAFSQAANAEDARARLMQGGAGKTGEIEVVQAGGVFRLFNGPYGTRAEAATAALELQNAGIGKPMIVQR